MRRAPISEPRSSPIGTIRTRVDQANARFTQQAREAVAVLLQQRSQVRRATTDLASVNAGGQCGRRARGPLTTHMRPSTRGRPLRSTGGSTRQALHCPARATDCTPQAMNCCPSGMSSMRSAINSTQNAMSCTRSAVNSIRSGINSTQSATSPTRRPMSSTWSAMSSIRRPMNSTRSAIYWSPSGIDSTSTGINSTFEAMNGF